MENADEYRTRSVSLRGAGKRVGCYHAAQRDAAGTVFVGIRVGTFDIIWALC